jgi:hypothetical protein
MQYCGIKPCTAHSRRALSARQKFKREKIKLIMRYSKEEVINEIKRVAELLNVNSLKRENFNKYLTISSSTVENKFGSWNEAILKAGLIPQNSENNLLQRK